MLDWMFDFFSEDEIVVDEVTGEKMTRAERRKLKRDRKHEDKLKKAQDIAVKIINEDEFLKMLEDS